MEIKETRDENGVCLVLTRNLDLTTCPALNSALEHLFRTPRQSVYLDISGISNVDSAGLTLLLKWHRRALKEERRFALVRASPYHRKVLEITQLDRTLVLYDRPGGERIAARPLYGPAWRSILRSEPQKPALELIESIDSVDELDDDRGLPEG